MTIDKISFTLSNNDFLPSPLPLQIRTAFKVVYSLIILLAVIGNVTVIVVVSAARTKLTVTDMYILSLAVADLLISLLNMPFQLNFFITNEWKMGLFLCKFSNYIQGVVVTASILTLTVIALDSYVTPLIIMILSYGAIAHRLWIQHPIGDMLENPRNHERSVKQKKKIIQMLMLLVLAFAVLWLPFFTAQLVEEYVEMEETFRTRQAVLQLIGYTNCCVNPIIYTFLNSHFQREFRSLCARRRLPHITRPRPRSVNRTNTLEICVISNRVP
ncbi:gastrin/cholecystokinin type B receptor-like [Patella vulgata]|uniref:gastrin/cholecystokinin type B receptor-like n=1 Tax=Patella vulgata TaxID=6465 RepID=UPI0021808F1E|nr:gastrin/cholecystokinin type B receptor-like [Patella vulgata]